MNRICHHACTRLFCFGLLFNFAATCFAADAPATPAKSRILFVTQSLDFKHFSVTRKENQLSAAERAIEALGVDSNLFRVDFTQDIGKDLSKENLQNYDILMFYTTGDRKRWTLDDTTLEYIFKDWMKQKGHGFIGVHSATDTLKDYEPYWEMIGGSFIHHNWGAGSKVTVVSNDPENPLVKAWGKEFPITDEIYQFKNWQPEKVHVLMSLDMSRSELNDTVRKDAANLSHVPIAWCKEYGDGKVFYISLGHNEKTWLDPRYMDTILAAIKWIRGDITAAAKPNPDVSAAEATKGKADITAKIAEQPAK
jgi:type 1 glutamine amidotransferase